MVTRAVAVAAIVAVIASLAISGAAAAALAPGLGSPLAAGSAPFAAAVADFDADGRPDIAVANELSNDVTILLGRPGGFTAEPGSPLRVGARPSDVAVADFNGDARSDLAVADFGSDEVTILLREAGGGFVEEAGSPIAVGSHPASVAAADLNGDDRPDLAVTNQASNTVSILLRQASGGFAEEPGSPLAVGSGPFDVIAADLDDDGRRDLAVTDYAGDTVTILRRQVGGGFAEEAGSPVPVGEKPLEAAVGDFDGDERPDLAIADQGSDQLTVLLRRGGGFVEAPRSPIAMPDGPYGVVRGDLDGDGLPDLAVTNEFADSVSILRGRPGGAFTAMAGTPVAAGHSPLRLDSADLDGDARPDLVIPDWEAGTVTVLVNALDTEITDGPPRFTNDPTPTFAFRSSDPGASFECRIDHAAFSACESPFTSAPLTDGEHAFQVRALDGPGNADPTPAERTFTVDTLAPETTITDGPADAATVDDTPPAYAFESSEPESSFQCATIFAPGSLLEKRNGFPCSSGLPVPPPPDGDNAFTVYAIDRAGNADPTPARRGFTFEHSPPRNLVRPTIARQSSVQGGGFRCDPGSWDRIPADPAFEFAWLRREPTGGIGGTIPKDYTIRATTRVFAPGPQDEGREFACRVTAHNAFGATDAASDSKLLADDLFDTKLANPYGNFRIRGIDVFQTVQPNSGAEMFLEAGAGVIGFPSLPGGGTPTNPPAQNADYAGVTMDADKPATAIVYVDTTEPGPAGPPLRVTLRAPGLGEKTQDIARPPRGSFLRWVRTSERDDPRFGVQFSIGDWVQQVGNGTLDLTASVDFPPGTSSYSVRECPLGIACAADDRYTLSGVPVQHVTSVHVVSLELRSGTAHLAPPMQVLGRANQLWPGGEHVLAFPAGDINVAGETVLTLNSAWCLPFKAVRSCRQAMVQSAMERWFADNEHTANAAGHYDVMLGIHNYTTGTPGNDVSEPGWTSGALTLATFVPLFTANDGTANRPITAAAHEFGHVIGAPHADRTCGGNSNGQVGEQWFPDDQGRLQGVKFDRFAPLVNGRTDPVVDGPTVLYDLMSYCPAGAGGDDSQHWLSAFNWNRAFATLHAYHSNATAARALQATGASAYAVGVVGPMGGRIARVVPPDGADAVPGPVDSPVRVRSLAADGRVLADVGVEVKRLDDVDAGGTFVGAVAPGAARVELVRAGAVLDSRTRSRPPSVRLRSVHAGGKLQLRWTARDPDNDSRTASVDYSADGGRTWRTVHDGPDTGHAALSLALLTGSRRARVRVNVSDGFSEARAVSRRLRITGTPPAVRIIRPATGEHPQDGTILTGAATDDAHRDLHGAALTWYAGNRRLGHGERITTRLAPGRVTLRLVARDHTGRRAQARRTVRVQARPLAFHLRYPQRVRRTARTLTVRVTASRPATLRVGRRHYAIGPKARPAVVRLPSRPAAGLLRMPFSIVGDHTRATGAIETLRWSP